ncbi:hypothetical protein BBP00_00000164 [Phytophthora kernoviae]|uniref:tRNA wybutosine-synthesizing protein 3 n=1 Tax=Phytophthora kernoviae TaxID=325452 RepID=A0A3F2S591_9STRA|nr:hypothetical protein BBP00_00000164 [Phytophthora kernoviae]
MRLKRESLRKLQAAEDKSPKGCIDEPIVDLIKTINANPNYVTSSSCSGRIAVFCGEAATGNGSDLITKGGKWLIAEHATITFDQLVTALRSPDATSSNSNMIIFKHEPFIMHVVCRDLDAAKELLQWGIACGFRESGVVLGNRKIMCAIRTTANGLEIPLGRSAEQLLVNEDYLRWIVGVANQKFEANKQKTDRLFDAFRAKFCQPVANQQASTMALGPWKELACKDDVKLVGHTAVQYGDSIVIFGGQGPTASGTTTRVADVNFFTPSNDGSLQQTYKAAAGTTGPSARMYHSAAVVGNQMIVFELGEVKSSNAAFVGHTSTWMPSNNSVYVLGGGFQCFGFGQFYSSPYQCPLTFTSLKEVTTAAAKSSAFGKTSGLNRNEVIRSTISAIASKYQLPADIEKAIPEKYEFVSDVLLIPRDSFLEPEWAPFAQEMWVQVCEATTPVFSRVARKAFIDSNEKRQSHVELLYTNHKALTSHRSKESPGWVEIRENSIIYGWDLTRVMFSSGNVTEKARMATIGCRGETIVDLFCGIGYYVLPFLVHGGAAFVHACEWNPDSVAALRFNLERNHVADRCKVYLGDNRETAPTIGAIADRVNLGLLPTSEKAWPLAVQVLKPSGGWFHVHDNVAVEDRKAWEQHLVDTLNQLAQQFGKHWTITSLNNINNAGVLLLDRCEDYSLRSRAFRALHHISDTVEVLSKKRFNAPFVQRRGDGFTEFEAMGMVQLVRTRWREGWDVIAQLHNDQHPGHSRSGDSLKKKFSRLYRANVPPRGAKNHSVVMLAHQVHREMIDGVTITPEEAAAAEAEADAEADAEAEAEEAEKQEDQDESFQTEEAPESEHSWAETPPEVAAASTPVSVPAPVVAAATPVSVVPRSRVAHRAEWKIPVTRTDVAVAPTVSTTLESTDDLLTSVLKVILTSQQQRDLDREENQLRWDEERKHRKKEMEQWRQEMDRRRAEDREERAESRRRHEEMMQMMMVLAGKNGSGQQRNAEC